MKQPAWSTWRDWSDIPESYRIRANLARQDALRPEHLVAMQDQISAAVIKAWRDVYFRERVKLMAQNLTVECPELPKIGVFRLVGISLGKSEARVRDIYYAGDPTTHDTEGE